VSTHLNAPCDEQLVTASRLKSFSPKSNADIPNLLSCTLLSVYAHMYTVSKLAVWGHESMVLRDDVPSLFLSTVTESTESTEYDTLSVSALGEAKLTIHYRLLTAWRPQRIRLLSRACKLHPPWQTPSVVLHAHHRGARMQQLTILCRWSSRRLTHPYCDRTSNLARPRSWHDGCGCTC